MSKSFDLNIGTRKITVTPAEDVEVKNRELTGTFNLMEGNAALGTLRFDRKSWENKQTGNLSYVELEAVAEDILFKYQ